MGRPRHLWCLWCVRSARIGAAAVARGCAAIVTVAVKVSSDAASELMEVTNLGAGTWSSFDVTDLGAGTCTSHKSGR